MLERRLRQVGADSLLAVTVLDLLVQARLAGGNIQGAETAATALADLSMTSKIDRVRAFADRARGRVESAGRAGAGVELLERAAAEFADLGMDLETGRTQLDLAHGLRHIDRDVAIVEGRNALSALHQAGARYERDQASALLRELGDASRPPMTHELDDLTPREVDVLRLLGEGLTNAQVAERLFISTKTAGNHVSNVLMKLGVSNRSQAAALARTRLGAEQGSR